MEYSMYINKTKFRPEGGKAANVANVDAVFGKQFRINGIRVFEKADGNMFLSMPSYLNKRTGKYEPHCTLSGGMKDRMLADLKEHLPGSDNVVHSPGEAGKADPTIKVRITPLASQKQPKLRGIATLSVGEDIKDVTCRIMLKEKAGEGMDPLTVRMPGNFIKKRDGGEEYREACNPVTAELRNRINRDVLSEYRQQTGEKTERAYKNEYEETPAGHTGTTPVSEAELDNEMYRDMEPEAELPFD